MKYDVIIIGSGLGGLTAGAKLANEGKKVLLIEQRSVAGGCATTFRRKDYFMDAVLIETECPVQNSYKARIFKELNISDHVEFVRLPEFYHFSCGRKEITVPDNYLKAEVEFTKHFPEEKQGIRKFMRVITGLKQELEHVPRSALRLFIQIPVFVFRYPNITRYRNKSVAEFLDSIIKNEDLKLALVANFAYYHDDPLSLSMLYFSAAQGGFYLGGSCYIKGGSQRLSGYLAQFIREKGGETIFGKLVTRILVENNKIKGVEYTNTDGNGEVNTAYADIIIVNASVISLVKMLLPLKQSEKLKQIIHKMVIGCSMVSVYLFFKKPAREFGCKHYSNILFPSDMKSMKDINFNIDYKDRWFDFVDYGQIDSGNIPEGKGAGVITTIDYLRNWENLTDDGYREKKEIVAHDLIEKLNGIFPGIRENIDFYEVSTPRTILRYTLNPMGTPYGFAEIPSQSGLRRLRNKSCIKNLYLASAWVLPGGGFTGAMLSGYFCAEEVLKNQ